MDRPLTRAPADPLRIARVLRWGGMKWGMRNADCGMEIRQSRFPFRIRLSCSSRRLLASGCDDHSNDDQSGDHETNARTYPEGVEHGEQEYEEKPSSPQANHIRPATADRSPPDHDQCNRGEEIFVADLQRRSPEISSQQRSGDPA